MPTPFRNHDSSRRARDNHEITDAHRLRFARDLSNHEASIRRACHAPDGRAARLAAALVVLAQRHDLGPEEFVSLLEAPDRTAIAAIDRIDHDGSKTDAVM